MRVEDEDGMKGSWEGGEPPGPHHAQDSILCSMASSSVFFLSSFDSKGQQQIYTNDQPI